MVVPYSSAALQCTEHKCTMMSIWIVNLIILSICLLSLWVHTYLFLFLPQSSLLYLRPTLVCSVWQSTPTDVCQSTKRRWLRCTRGRGDPKCHHTSSPYQTMHTGTCCKVCVDSKLEENDGGSFGFVCWDYGFVIPILTLFVQIVRTSHFWSRTFCA